MYGPRIVNRLVKKKKEEEKNSQSLPKQTAPRRVEETAQ
jgi:hypothetical protein